MPIVKASSVKETLHDDGLGKTLRSCSVWTLSNNADEMDSHRALLETIAVRSMTFRSARILLLVEVRYMRIARNA